jgi:hypothetical protein
MDKADPRENSELLRNLLCDRKDFDDSALLSVEFIRLFPFKDSVFDGNGEARLEARLRSSKLSIQMKQLQHQREKQYGFLLNSFEIILISQSV